jgi:hypothetical protein
MQAAVATAAAAKAATVAAAATAAVSSARIPFPVYLDFFFFFLSALCRALSQYTQSFRGWLRRRRRLRRWRLLRTRGKRKRSARRGAHAARNKAKRSARRATQRAQSVQENALPLFRFCCCRRRRSTAIPARRQDTSFAAPHRACRSQVRPASSSGTRSTCDAQAACSPIFHTSQFSSREP